MEENGKRKRLTPLVPTMNGGGAAGANAPAAAAYDDDGDVAPSPAVLSAPADSAAAREGAGGRGGGGGERPPKIPRRVAAGDGGDGGQDGSSAGAGAETGAGDSAADAGVYSAARGAGALLVGDAPHGGAPMPAAAAAAAAIGAAGQGVQHGVRRLERGKGRGGVGHAGEEEPDKPDDRCRVRQRENPALAEQQQRPGKAPRCNDGGRAGAVAVAAVPAAAAAAAAVEADAAAENTRSGSGGDGGRGGIIPPHPTRRNGSGAAEVNLEGYTRQGTRSAKGPFCFVSAREHRKTKFLISSGRVIAGFMLGVFERGQKRYYCVGFDYVLSVTRMVFACFCVCSCLFASCWTYCLLYVCRVAP